MLRKFTPTQKKQYIVLATLIILIFLGYLYNQNKSTSEFQSNSSTSSTETKSSTGSEVALIRPIDDMVPITFRSFKVQSSKPGAEIIKEVGRDNLDFVLAFNRIDVRHIQVGLDLVIPSQLSNWNTLTPFPTVLPDAVQIPKLLVVSQRIQAFASYEAGTLVRWGTVSSGKKDTPTPSRLYFTNWKGKLVTSTLEGGYILPWAFNLDSLGGIALHQFDLPGYPASHSCVRMSAGDAEWLYNWADQWILSIDGQKELAAGTPVLIFGDYSFGKTAPWKKLPNDPLASTISIDELSKALSPELTSIETKRQERIRELQ